MISEPVEGLFQSEGNGPIWHINTSEELTSLCGQRRMRYNVDNTADSLPYNGELCPDCKAVKDGTAVVVGEAGPEEFKKRKSRPANSRK